MSRRSFAFDWGGCLECNESLRQLARDLYVQGYEVHIVPACGEIVFPYKEALQAVNVPYTGLHVIIHDTEHSPQMPGGSKWIADEKVKKCKELGCSVLYDDNPFNLAAAGEAGIEAVMVYRHMDVPRPPELVQDAK